MRYAFTASEKLEIKSMPREHQTIQQVRALEIKYIREFNMKVQQKYIYGEIQPIKSLLP